MTKKTKKQESKNGVQTVTGWMESALHLSQAFERLLVDVVVAYIPLLAPAIPASIAFVSLDQVLDMPLPISIIGAGVVEFLGLGTVSTTMQFVDYNASKGEDDPPAPTKMAIGTMLFYLVVVLTVNVLLDNSGIIEKIAKALLSTLSIAGAVTISMRSQHSRRLAAKLIKDAKLESDQKALAEDERAYKRQVAAERRQQKHELKLKELELKVSETQPQEVKVSPEVSETSSPKPETYGKWKHWKKVPDAEKLKIVRMTVEQVVESYGVEERTAYHWLEYAKRDTGLVGEVAQFQEALRVDQLQVLEEV